MTRLLLLVAAALVVVLAAAGVGAGAEWDVYPGAGTPIQDAIDDAGDGDTIYAHGTNARECGCEQACGYGQANHADRGWCRSVRL